MEGTRVHGFDGFFCSESTGNILSQASMFFNQTHVKWNGANPFYQTPSKVH
jgi:hypothetical protein